MKTIYAVLWNSGDGYWAVYGLYETRAEAEAAKRKRWEEDMPHHMLRTIAEWPVGGPLARDPLN